MSSSGSSSRANAGFGSSSAGSAAVEKDVNTFVKVSNSATGCRKEKERALSARVSGASADGAGTPSTAGRSAKAQHVKRC